MKNSNILKVSASFNYDRYVCGKTTSYAVYSGTDNNIIPNYKTNFLNEQNNPSTNKPGQQRLVPVRGASGVVFYDSSVDTRTTAEVNRRFYNASGQPIIN